MARKAQAFDHWVTVARVKSSSDAEIEYSIQKRNAGEWACSCPHFLYRNGDGGKGICKHLRQAWDAGQHGGHKKGVRVLKAEAF